MSDHDMSLPTLPSIQADGTNFHGRGTNRNCNQNGLNSLNSHDAAVGVKLSDEVLNPNPGDAVQRRKMKSDDPEHADEEYDEFSFNVGHASGSSSSLNTAFIRIDSMKSVSRCRARMLLSNVPARKRRKLCNSDALLMHTLPLVSDFQALRGNGLANHDSYAAHGGAQCSVNDAPT